MDSLSVELLLRCTTYLRHHDLASLARVSKALSLHIQPLIWSTIDLRAPGYDVESAHLELYSKAQEGDQLDSLHANIEELIDKYGRPLGFTLPADDSQSSKIVLRSIYRAYFLGLRKSCTEKINIFLGLAIRMRDSNAQGWKTMSDSVRRIRITADTSSPECQDEEGNYKLDIYNTIASLANLQQLELYSQWDDDYQESPLKVETTPMLQHLSRVKLEHYVPCTFVSQVLTVRPEIITHLDLFVLDAPPDQDVGENDLGCAPNMMTWMSPGLSSRFTSLTHLTLRKISQTLSYWSRNPLSFDVTADENVLNEWAALIRGTRSTLVELLLELRPALPEVEIEGLIFNEAPEKFLRRPGDVRFCAIVLPALMEPAEWPSMKKLTLREIQVYGLSKGTANEVEVSRRKPTGRGPQPRRVGFDGKVDGQESVERRFAEAEVIFEEGKYVGIDDSGGMIQF